MSATDQAMGITQITWHVASGTVEFTLVSREPPPPPEWVDESQWYGGGGDVLTFSVPAKKAVSAPATGIAVTGTNADGTPQYTKYTWDGTAWSSPVRCDSNGNPL